MRRLCLAAAALRRRPCVPGLDGGCARLDLAGRRAGAAAVLRRSGPVRGRPAPRRRHRRRARPRRARTGRRDRLVRRLRARRRPRGHDHDRRWLRRDAAPARCDERRARQRPSRRERRSASVGESSDAVTLQPHVHLGVRVAADPNGYVDPLGLLPRAPAGSRLPPSPVSEPPVAAPCRPPPASPPRAARRRTGRRLEPADDAVAARPAQPRRRREPGLRRSRVLPPAARQPPASRP